MEKNSTRWLILSDIHSNLEALTACLAKASKIGFDRVACLGDLVGYGPNPNEVVEWAKDLKSRDDSVVFVKGNHDESISDLSVDISAYNPSAERAIRIQRDMITDVSREFLKGLHVRAEVPPVQFVHGSPDIWDAYVVYGSEARLAMQFMTEDMCFIGHTHRPMVWKDAVGHDKIVNVGSVGQPRDGDPRACFVIYDESDKKIEHVRVKYDIPAVQEKMKKLNMPEHLIERIAEGY